MREKFKLKDVKQSLSGTYRVLRFSAMFLGFALIVQMITLPTLLAQETTKHKVTGKVIAASDTSPVPGATIKIKGIPSGTITDSNGNFSLDVADNDILEISFVGYVSEEVTVAGRSSVEVKLVEDITKLDEVTIVSIGYGTSKRKDVTGSISSITGNDLRKTSPVTIGQALQGKIPGMVVQQASGQPGGDVVIQIRGVSTFGNQGRPLFVIDGIIMGNTATLGSGVDPLAGIIPSEIESIDVLKDASATAIYGSQASFGVIVITTKKGQIGVPRISYEFSTGFQQLPKKLGVMNLQEYATFLNERNAALGWGFDNRPGLANPEYLGKGTDWQKELFRNAPMTDHTLTMSGGDTRTQYMLAGSYHSQEGIAMGSDLKRISVRLNLDNKTTNWLKIGTRLQVVNIKENVNSSNSNVIQTALSQTPDIPVTNADGSWGGAYNSNGWVLQTQNPVAVATINKDQTARNQFFGDAYAEITFTKDLVLRNELTGSISMSTEDKYNPTYVMGLLTNNLNSATYNTAKNSNTSVRNYLTYSHLFFSKHTINVMVGHEAQLSMYESGGATRSNFPSNSVQVISSGDEVTAKNSGNKGQGAQESYFGRLNIGISDKYLLTGNLRADGSSNFASGHRWVTTYSGAFAWKINNEAFLNGVDAINELKLRIGYGLTNNQNIAGYAYTSTLGTISNGLAGNAQLIKSIGNPLVEWEKTKYGNIGLDGAIFKNRISFSVDFYNRRTNGLLMQIPLPLYSGTAINGYQGQINAPYVNIGDVNNKGYDFRISTTNINGKKFSWKTDLTLSHNINKVNKLNTEGASLNGTYSKTVVGGSIGEFYGYKIDGGVFATKDELLNHAKPVKNGAPLPVGAAAGSIWYGDLKFKDMNGDGVIDEQDQCSLGSPTPKYQIGLNNTFSYRNIDLNIFFNANYGNKVYNQLRVKGDDPGTSFVYFKSLKNHADLVLNDPNGLATDIDNVYVSNPNTEIVGLRNDNTNDNNRNSNKFIEDGSFIRCKSISLGYTFSEKLIKKVVIVKSLRLYVNVTNAFIFTKYKGMDPEIGSWDPLNAGVDNGFYPQSRVYTFGANIAF